MKLDNVYAVVTILLILRKRLKSVIFLYMAEFWNHIQWPMPLYDPLPLSVGGICEYDGISLLWFGYDVWTVDLVGDYPQWTWPNQVSP